MPMLVSQKFLTQRAFRPLRPWKMRFTIWSTFFLSAIKKKISQLVTALWSKELIRSSALLISTIVTKTMYWRLGIPCTPIIGLGYVPEAARALIDLAFKELSLHKIELTCFGYNTQSQRVAEKLGFTLEARIRDRKDAQGNRCDDLRYGLLKSEWEVD